MIRFETLLTLSVTHEYYGGPCPHFGYVIPTETVRTLKGGRMLTRTAGGALHVLYEADAQGEPLVPGTGAVLRVALALQNPAVANVTAPGPGVDGSCALYRNAPDATTLAPPTGVAMVGSLAGLTLQAPARPVTVEVRDATGTALLEETVTAAALATEVSFDLAALPPGALTVVEQYPGGVERSTRWYYHPELTAAGAFGVAELVIDAGFYDAPAELTVAFAAREDSLKYYVVGTKYTDADVNALSVKDAGFTEEQRPEVKFTKVPPSAFSAADLPPGLLAGGAAKLALFRSEDPVPRRDGGRRKIQLLKNSDLLIANLPQPGDDRASADLIIHLAKP